MPVSARSTPPLLLALFLLPLAGCQNGDADGSGSAPAAAGPSDTTWTRLFDGTSLDGWTKRGGAATYRVADSAIVGTSVRNSENTFLLTEKTYGDFVLEFDVRVHDSLNSGVQIRSKVRDDGRVYGPQVEIEASLEDGAEAGYIYGEATGRGWLTPEDRLIPHTTFRDGAWNHYRIRAVGPRIQTWINGQKVADLTHEEIYANHRSGHIGLQVHGVGDEGPYEVRWRNLRLTPLPSSS